MGAGRANEETRGSAGLYCSTPPGIRRQSCGRTARTPACATPRDVAPRCRNGGHRGDASRAAEAARSTLARSVRLTTSSCTNTCLRRTLTVLTEMPSASAISTFVAPLAARRAIAYCRAVSGESVVKPATPRLASFTETRVASIMTLASRGRRQVRSERRRADLAAPRAGPTSRSVSQRAPVTDSAVYGVSCFQPSTTHAGDRRRNAPRLDPPTGTAHLVIREHHLAARETEQAGAWTQAMRATSSARLRSRSAPPELGGERAREPYRGRLRHHRVNVFLAIAEIRDDMPGYVAASWI